MINEGKDPIQYSSLFSGTTHSTALKGGGLRMSRHSSYLIKSVSRYSNCFVHHAEVSPDQSIRGCDCCIDNCICCLEVRRVDP